MKNFYTFLLLCTIGFIGCSKNKDVDFDPTNFEEISSIQHHSSGDYCQIRGVVYAVGSTGALISDGHACVFYYNLSHNLELADSLVIKGELLQYGGMNEFTSSATVIKLGKGTVRHQQPSSFTYSQAKSWISAPCIQYVSTSGKLSISGTHYNVLFDDVQATDVMLTIDAPSDVLSSLANDDKIKIEGYTIYTVNSKYIQIICTNVTKISNSNTGSGSGTSGTGTSGTGTSGTGQTTGEYWGKVTATVRCLGPGAEYSAVAQSIDGERTTIDYVYYYDTNTYKAYGGAYCANPEANGGKGVAFDAKSGFNSVRIYASYTYYRGDTYMYYLYLNFTLP